MLPNVKLFRNELLNNFFGITNKGTIYPAMFFPASGNLVDEYGAIQGTYTRAGNTFTINKTTSTGNYGLIQATVPFNSDRHYQYTKGTSSSTGISLLYSQRQTAGVTPFNGYDLYEINYTIAPDMILAIAVYNSVDVGTYTITLGTFTPTAFGSSYNVNYLFMDYNKLYEGTGFNLYLSDDDTLTVTFTADATAKTTITGPTLKSISNFTNPVYFRLHSDIPTSSSIPDFARFTIMKNSTNSIFYTELLNNTQFISRNSAWTSMTDVTPYATFYSYDAITTGATYVFKNFRIMANYDPCERDYFKDILDDGESLTITVSSVNYGTITRSGDNFIIDITTAMTSKSYSTSIHYCKLNPNKKYTYYGSNPTLTTGNIRQMYNCIHRASRQLTGSLFAQNTFIAGDNNFGYYIYLRNLPVGSYTLTPGYIEYEKTPMYEVTDALITPGVTYTDGTYFNMLLSNGTLTITALADVPAYNSHIININTCELPDNIKMIVSPTSSTSTPTYEGLVDCSLRVGTNSQCNFEVAVNETTTSIGFNRSYSPVPERQFSWYIFLLKKMTAGQVITIPNFKILSNKQI